MMSIVKEQGVLVPMPMRADAPHQIVFVPFVDEHQIGAVQRVVQVERRQVVRSTPQLRIDLMKRALRRRAVFGLQMPQTPAVARLENAHIISARQQFADDAAQKVRVAVIPIGDERVAEDDNSHR
jgi:hypothetical protein